MGIWLKSLNGTLKRGEKNIWILWEKKGFNSGFLQASVCMMFCSLDMAQVMPNNTH